MDSQAKKALLESGFEKLNIPLAVESYEIVTAGDNIQVDPDLMQVKFILCHEGVNANGDFFTKEVLHQAQLTPKNKPIDWEHGQPIIGTILDSSYMEDMNGRGYVEATGVVWKFIYPELSGSIKSKAATGELKLSMECYYKEANYKVGDTLYTNEQASDLGIIPYVGREYMGNKVTRVFSEVLFGGVGVVANPADKEAVFLSVAKDLGARGLTSGGETQEQISDLSEAIANAITRTVNDFQAKINTDKDVTAVTMAKYVKAFDRAKGSVVAKFNKDEVKTKEQLVGEVQSALNTFFREVSAISQDYYKGIANDLDKSESKDLFFNDIQSTISMQVYKHYAELSDNSLEAYLLDVAEDYFIYELIDYSKQYPNSVRMFKGFYSLVDSEINIDFSNALEVEQVYVEKASIENPDESEEEKSMAKVDKENEQVALEELEAAKKNDGDPEDLKDGGNDEDTEDKKGKKKSKAESELESRVASLEAELVSANEAKASLESKVAEYEARFAEVEATKVAEARKAELTDLGIELSEARQAKLKGMTDEDYTDFKDLLVEVAGKKVEKPVVASEEAKEEVESAEASEDDDAEEEIVVEGAKANAGLNFEQETPKAVKPFGHLSPR